MISIEITEQERDLKYFNDLTNLEPQFACIGVDWIKNRNRDYKLFMKNYADLRVEA